MKIGVLPDIHGNVWGLKAALDDAKRRAVERFINLGDILYGPLKPRDTFELLHTIDAVTIQGNKVPHEHALAAEQSRRQGRDDWARWMATGRAGA
jgi:predicted phosphodiesterase